MIHSISAASRLLFRRVLEMYSNCRKAVITERSHTVATVLFTRKAVFFSLSLSCSSPANSMFEETGAKEQAVMGEAKDFTALKEVRRTKP